MTDSCELAVDAIKAIYDYWRVDEDRVQWVGDPSAATIFQGGYGFDWWPGDFKVRLRIERPHPDTDFPAYRLSLRTDFLCEVDVTHPKFKENLSNLYWLAPTFAMCAHPTTPAQIVGEYVSLGEPGLDLTSSKVWLASTAYVYEGTKKWLPRFFADLGILQLTLSHFGADATTRLLGGKADRSTPPGRGSPTSLTNILKVEKLEIVPHGEQPSKWLGSAEFAEIIDKRGRGDSGFGRVYDGGLAIEVPFGGTTATVRLDAYLQHARLGNGLWVALSVPYLADLESLNVLTIELNYLEDRAWSTFGMPLTGNWFAVGEDVQGTRSFRLTFGHFVPNVLYQRGLAEVLVVDAMSRARWCREILLPELADLPTRRILDNRT